MSSIEQEFDESNQKNKNFNLVNQSNLITDRTNKMKLDSFNQYRVSQDNQIKQNHLVVDDFTEPFDDEETVERRNGRKNQIERNMHNQKAYYDQKNNIDSDEASDCIQSDLDSKTGRLHTYDEKMKELVKMFIESFVPFNLLHGDYFSNIIRNSFSIRKMPKLIQFKDLFRIMYELGTKYVCQTVSGSKSYSLIFEFWKTTNRRHQYITVRVAYIDVFVRR